MPYEGHGQPKAPRYIIPDQRIVTIEHPCIIQNVDRGIKSLGGDRALNRFLDPNIPISNKTITASLRPDDPYAQAVRSMYVKTDNVLLAIRVPKRTGRKRKRGSDDPFEADPDWKQAKNSPVEGPVVLRSLGDNPNETTVSPLGLLQESWRFRSLPDFQYATTGGHTFQLIKDSLISSDLSKIKQFTLDTSRKLGPQEEIQPPPIMQLSGTSYGYA
jgi:general transcription factor 3C polypeptide 5 (transcription factor C subunit 1)